MPLAPPSVPLWLRRASLDCPRSDQGDRSVRSWFDDQRRWDVVAHPREHLDQGGQLGGQSDGPRWRHGERHRRHDDNLRVQVTGDLLNGCDQSSPTGSRGSEADGCFKLTHCARRAELGFLGTVLDLALRPESQAGRASRRRVETRICAERQDGRAFDCGAGTSGAAWTQPLAGTCAELLGLGC
jgi:hypothetical protein